jgi:hypothetical protein
LVTAVSSLDKLLRSWPLRDISPSVDWTAHNIPPLLLAKVPTYRLIWRWALALRHSRATRDAAALRETLLNGWLFDEDEDRLFELFAFSRVIVALYEARAWSSLRLDRSPTGVVAQAADLSVTVLLDQSPSTKGSYEWLLSRYKGIDGRGRRPDIQIITRSGDDSGVTFIEVKNTDPHSRYGRDSVVKVLGYLKDYELLWRSSSVRPRALLLYPHGLEPLFRLEARADDEVLLSTASTLDADVRMVLKKHLSL